MAIIGGDSDLVLFGKWDTVLSLHIIVNFKPVSLFLSLSTISPDISVYPNVNSLRYHKASWSRSPCVGLQSEKNIYIVRFPQTMHIPSLKQCILSSYGSTTSRTIHLLHNILAKQVVNDFTLLCTLLGNDFVPKMMFHQIGSAWRRYCLQRPSYLYHKASKKEWSRDQIWWEKNQFFLLGCLSNTSKECEIIHTKYHARFLSWSAF